MILILGALKFEVSSILKKMKNIKILASGSIPAYEGLINGKKILLVVTGMGKKNAETAAGFIKEYRFNSDNVQNKNEPIKKIIIAGVSGALHRNFLIGDIVICKSVYFVHQAGSKTAADESMPVLCKSIQVEDPQPGNCPVYCGNLLTVSNIVTDNNTKESLNSRFDADAVDMESYWLLQFLETLKIPVICIRSISDNMKYDLSKSYERLVKKNSVD
ncbi:MAG: hypothetical protein M1308_17795, partial [Actinobacteria bacterium]|nr:hypothetical protein [Actinomycetota bacterium]